MAMMSKLFRIFLVTVLLVGFAPLRSSQAHDPPENFGPTAQDLQLIMVLMIGGLLATINAYQTYYNLFGGSPGGGASGSGGDGGGNAAQSVAALTNTPAQPMGALPQDDTLNKPVSVSDCP